MKCVYKNRKSEILFLFLYTENPQIVWGFKKALAVNKKPPCTIIELRPDKLQDKVGKEGGTEMNQINDYNSTNTLSHTTWNCMYHIVFAPKYRRKVFYGEKRAEIGKILRELCE